MKTKSAKDKKHSVAVVVNDYGLTASEAEQALRIQKSAPDQVAAITDFRESFNRTSGYFWKMVEKLREPVAVRGHEGKVLPPMRMNGREIGLLLQSMGFNKVRISEVNRVVEMADDVFDKARKLQLGKDDALAVARGTKAIVGEGEDAEVVAVEREPVEGSATATTPEYHKAHAAFREAFHALLVAEATTLKAQTDGVPYEFKGELDDGRAYDVRIFVDRKPTK